MKKQMILLIIMTVCSLMVYSQNNDEYELKDSVGKWILIEPAQSSSG
ncbi:hypothetical protein [Treponema brennaborense]|uniref:Uncharacterized protein n=1 Tax=Treponema brennaborense (strain DSM 12168 / CIP 105900 / DD5/3) TaxID=906968 RepID=F4LNY8_TREBD|nr:hypothetical protein [Treponema brennaborense]AEE17965.1 hypothetical protein Trebr_2561 [Treponema brennaborense DSM 12168]